jgi:hypothetical protein
MSKNIHDASNAAIHKFVQEENKTLSLGPSALSLATYQRRLVKEAIHHGGCTLNTLAYEAPAPASGFVVGGGGDSLCVPVKDFHGHSEHGARKQVMDWLLSHIDADGYPDHSFVGSWVDSGNIWFDFCRIFDGPRDDAYRLASNLARVRGEMAIYDLAAKESIFVD